MSLPRNHEHDLDRLLGDEGGEFGSLYRRLSRVDPPRRLDRAVLGEAARAVHGRKPRPQRWIVGLGSAAGIVLAAGIAWQVGHDALREPTPGPVHDSAPMVVPVEPITERSVRKPNQVSEMQDTTAPVTNAPAPAAAAPPPPAAAMKQRAPARPVAAPAHTPPEQKPKAAPASAPPAAFPAETESLREEQPVAAAPSDALGATKADTAGPFRQAPAPRTRTIAPPAPSSSVELRRDLRLAPAAWLVHVRDLLEHGRRQQAIESLQLFRRTHPDQSIPDDLRVLLD